MKRIKEPFIIFTCLLMWALLLGGWTYTYDIATPLGSDAPSVLDDRDRETKAAVQERMNVCGFWPLAGTEVSHADAGKFRYLIFREPNDLTTMSADESAIFSKNVSSVTELHWIDESDNVVQLTSGGYIYGNNLKADSVLTAAIADANVTLALMADNSIDSDQYVDGSIDQEHTSYNPVVQVVNTQTGAVNTGTTLIPADDTIPQNTEGDEYITLAITPTSATNKLKIDVVCFLSHSAVGNETIALFQDSTANALAATGHTISSNNYPSTIKLTHYMTSGTTSETTFKVRAGNTNSGTTTFNGFSGARKYGGVCASSITITEIKV